MKLTLSEFEENKKQIFDTIISSIEAAIENDQPQIYIKSLRVAGETVDVVAEKKDWSESLGKALVFYRSSEDYESCAKCQKMIDLLVKEK
jgi:hypothetical protein